MSVEPLASVFVASGAWWFLSALYSIFVKGMSSNSGLDTIIPKHEPYRDISISFWNQNSLWLPILNFILVCTPLPSMVTAYLRRKGESEDLMFVLSIFSSIALFGGQIWSIRLLGLTGTVFGFWWCYELSLLQQKSNAIL
jgi:hypothetical protein